MKNTFGHNYSVTIFGESHGEAIGCVIDGLAPGIKLDMDFIASVMEKRKAKGRIFSLKIQTQEVMITKRRNIGCALLMQTILPMKSIWAGRTIAVAVISAAELLHRW